MSFRLIHVAEEYTGGFPHEIVDLFDSPRDWTEKSFLLTFVYGFGALWCLAAAGTLYQVRVANFMLWFYALGAGLLNAISHFVFPVIKGGYFLGLYTASGHLILSVPLITFLFQESRPCWSSRRPPASSTSVRARDHAAPDRVAAGPPTS